MVGDKDKYTGTFSTSTLTLTHTNNANNNFVKDGILRLWREEGIRGFYRGMIPAIFGVSNGAVQFMAYEEIRALWGKHLKKKNKEMVSYVCCAV